MHRQALPTACALQAGVSPTSGSSEPSAGRDHGHWAGGRPPANLLGDNPAGAPQPPPGPCAAAVLALPSPALTAPSHGSFLYRMGSSDGSCSAGLRGDVQEAPGMRPGGDTAVRTLCQTHALPATPSPPPGVLTGPPRHSRDLCLTPPLLTVTPTRLRVRAPVPPRAVGFPAHGRPLHPQADA